MTSGRRFVPDSITVSTGEVVTFTNDDDESHTVTARQGSLEGRMAYFASGGASSEAEARAHLQVGLLAEGETFEVSFGEAGTYRYFCIPHESQGMKGTIVVQG